MRWLPWLSLFALAFAGCERNAPAEREGAAVETPEAPKQQQQKKKKRVRGIAGQKAPKLAVAKWFNLGAGQQAPEMANHRGKVVFLFFYQSW